MSRSFKLPASLFGAVLCLAGCTDPPVEPQENCGGRGACAAGIEQCHDGVCKGIVSEHCGAVPVACAPHERCTDFACECDPMHEQSDELCGCGGPGEQPLDCTAQRVVGVCLDGQCVCDEARHVGDPLACGCPLPEVCAPDEYCGGGVCRCDPQAHGDTPDNCGCQGPCPPGYTCDGGSCICPEGHRLCGGVCVVADAECCDEADGSQCQAGWVCEDTPGGARCRPQDSQACRMPDNGAYVSFCVEGTQCHPSAEGGMTCVDTQRFEACVNGDHQVTHLCPIDTPCLPPAALAQLLASGPRGRLHPALVDGCRPEGYTLCRDDQTICLPGDACIEVAAGFVCRSTERDHCVDEGGRYVASCGVGEECVNDPDGSWVGCHPVGWAPCHGPDNRYSHSCPPGKSCAARQDDPGAGALAVGCVDPGDVVCPDGRTVCTAGDECVFDHEERWICMRPGAERCFDALNRYVGSCPTGRVCQPTADGFECRPADSTICEDGNGRYLRYCPAGQQCARGGQQCVPGDAVVCEDGTPCPAGHVCLPIEGGRTVCMPPDARACHVSRTGGPPANIGFCGADTVCEVIQGGADFVCRPEREPACRDLVGRFIGTCPEGMTCLRGQRRCVLPESDVVCPDHQTVCAPGQRCSDELGHWVCRPEDAVPCYENGPTGTRVAHWCNSGEVCAASGAGRWACHPEGQIACYDYEGWFVRTCNPGQKCYANGTECIPETWEVCADGVTLCLPGSACRHEGLGRWECQPDDTKGCYWRGEYRGFCQPDDRCIFDRLGNVSCMPEGEGFTLCAEISPSGRVSVNHYCFPGWECILNDSNYICRFAN